MNEIPLNRKSTMGRRIVIAGIGLLAAAGSATRAIAAEGVAGGGDAQAARFVQESYQFNESRRRDWIARQLDLNYRMIGLSGYSPLDPNAFAPYSIDWLSRVPGDVRGYPQPRPIEHPVGHESAQTGPNRWIYRPVYAAELQVRAAAQSPAASNPPGAAQRPGPSDPFAGEPAAQAAAPADAQQLAPRKVGPRAF